ncbi:MAG: carotenoid oxygenase family protein, partial [Betaproteobacteria bacterium]
LDIESGKTDRFSFGDSATVEEHVFVSKPGSNKEGEGYLVGVGFDVKRQQTFGSVFEAGNLAAGPMAIVRLPYWVPACFHGNFYAA